MAQNNFKVIDYNLDEFSKFMYNRFPDNIKKEIDDSNKDLKSKIPLIINKIIIDNTISDSGALILKNDSSIEREVKRDIFFTMIDGLRRSLILNSIHYFKNYMEHYIVSKINPSDDKDFVNIIETFKTISILNIGDTSSTNHKYLTVNDSEDKNNKIIVIADKYLPRYFSIDDYLSLDGTRLSEYSLYSDLYYNSVGIYIKLRICKQIHEYFFKNTSNSLNEIKFSNNCNNFNDYFTQLQYYSPKVHNDCILFDLTDNNEIYC